MWNPEDYAKNSEAQWKWAQELRRNIDWSKYRSILLVNLYLAKHPLDSQGLTHVAMVRLEVDAYKV